MFLKKSSYLDERLCYYAEYRDEIGNSYYYLDSRFFYKSEFRGTLSISEQQFEDAQELKQKFSCVDEEFLRKHKKQKLSKSIEDESFFDKMNRNDSSCTSTENITDKNSLGDGENTDGITIGRKHSQGVSN